MVEGNPEAQPPVRTAEAGAENTEAPKTGTGSSFLDEVIQVTGGPTGQPTEATPPAAQAKPPATGEAAATRPPAGQPTGTETPPPVQEANRPPAGDSPPPTRSDNPLFAEPEAPPAATPTDRPPAAAPQDALAGVVDPTFKALVEDKTRKVVTHIENGAALLKQGRPTEAINAYKQAADIVSPEEQKQFLLEAKRLQEQIKLETQKQPAEQDGKKLEALKELERKTRMLGLADMFTEVNSGLILTQTGDLNAAKDCFARAFLNERALVEQKALPPEGYLSKEPNLGARINEISQRNNVQVWKLIGDAVQRAGVDPRLVGIDTGRGPPVRTEGGAPPDAVPGPRPDQQPGPQNFVRPEAPVVPGRTEQGIERPVGQGTEGRTEQGTERLVKFSPTDAQGRTPLEQVAKAVEEARAKDGPVDQATRNAILKAIAHADQGLSPKIEALKTQQREHDAQLQQFLDAKVGNTQETVRDAVRRVDVALLGTYEQRKNPQTGRDEIVKTKPGLFDKLNPPESFYTSEEVKAVQVPADYQAPAKPAEFKGTDEEWKRRSFLTEAYREDTRMRYGSLDESMSQEEYARTLDLIKTRAGNDKAIVDLLTERDTASTQARTALFQLNLVTNKIPAEQNQSSMARAMYADLLYSKGDNEGAKKYFTEAYAFNQLPNQAQELRGFAIQAGADPIQLFEAAVKQSHDRGSENWHKAMRPELLLQEGALIFDAAKPEKKAEVAAKLAPMFQQLQTITEEESALVSARSAELSKKYEQLFPDANVRKELNDIEKRLGAQEKAFTETDRQNLDASRNPDLTEQQRAEKLKAVETAHPEWARDKARFAEIVGDKGPALVDIKGQMMAHVLDIDKSTENLFFSRAIVANIQKELGQTDAAKKTLTEAFQSIPPEYRQKILQDQRNPAVKELTGALQIGDDVLNSPAPAAREHRWRAAAPSTNGEATLQQLGVPVQAGGPQSLRPNGDAPPAVPPAGGDRPPAVPPAGGDRPPAQTEQRPGADQPPATTETAIPGTNPRFAKMTEQEIMARIERDAKNLEAAEEVKLLYRELIARYDAALPVNDYGTSVAAINIISEALKQGKVVRDGKLTDQPLSQEQRYEYHRAIFQDFEAMNNQVQIRSDFAQYLKASGQMADAEKMAIEARDRAEELVKPRQVLDGDGKPVKDAQGKDVTVRIVDSMQREIEKLYEDMPNMSNGQMRQQMQGAAIFLKGADVDSGAIKTPINTNKFLAQFYLGTEIVPKLDGQGKVIGIQDIKFGQSSAFKPQLAIDPANRALALSRDILKLDPLDSKTAKENPGVASLFGVLAEVVQNPEKYKLYVAKEGETFVNEKGETVYLKSGELYGKNPGGVPILIDMHSKANLERQVRKDSAFDSGLLDAVVAVGIIGGVALSKNPKLATFFERSLGKYVPHAGTIGRIGTVGATVTAGAFGRHYGYKAMTGVEESWTDTAVHVAGSMAAAEVGGILSGRGSMFGRVNGPARTRLFDTNASAQFYSREGYQTTGKMMDLLKSQGYLNEAKVFANLDRSTPLIVGGKVNPQVATALERANLTGARAGTVAEAMIKDAKVASGIKADELARRVTALEGGAPKTVDDLYRMVEADQKAVSDLSKKVDALDDKVPINEALKDIAGTPEGQAFLATAERYGLRRVGQVKALAAESEKFGFRNVFPKLAEMETGGVISRSTSLVEAASKGTHAFDGPGLQRLLSLVPAAEREALFTRAALEQVMKADPITGNRSIIARLRDGAVVTRDATASAYRAVSTREGWNMIRTSVGETLAPLGTRQFYSNVARATPGAVVDATKYGATKLGEGAMWSVRKVGSGLDGSRRFVTENFNPLPLDPAKATPQALARSRFVGGFYGSLGAVGTYNTIVKPYDLTGQVFGVELPQVGGGSHPVHKDASGNDYNWWGALKESHFPTIQGLENPENMPYYMRYVTPIAEAAVGTPGQALFGAFFVKPGAIYKPVWSNPEVGMFRKSMQSAFPLSPTFWNNANARVFSGPITGAAGVFAGTAVPSSFDAIGPRLGVGRYKDLLRNAQRPIENAPLPQQRPNLDEVRDQVQVPPVQQVPPATEVPAPVNPPQGDKRPAPQPTDRTKKPGAGGLEEPPPPGG